MESCCHVSCFLSCVNLTSSNPRALHHLQLGGWPVTQNRTDFNSTLGLLMRDYATFPFFSLRVGPNKPEETAKGEKRTFIQASLTQHLSPLLSLGESNCRMLCDSLRALLYSVSFPID